MAFRFSTPTSRRSSPDFFQLLDSDAGSILVGGKDAVFNLSLADLSEYTDEVSERASFRFPRLQFTPFLSSSLF